MDTHSAAARFSIDLMSCDIPESTLIDNLRDMVNSELLSDVTFIGGCAVRKGGGGGLVSGQAIFRRVGTACCVSLGVFRCLGVFGCQCCWRLFNRPPLRWLSSDVM